MFSGSTDSIKCVLVAKPTRSQAHCSHFLRKHSCFCNACIVTRKHQSELKQQQGAQRKWLVDAFPWPNAALMQPDAAGGSDGVTAPGLRYSFQVWTSLNHTLPEELRVKKAWWLMFSTWLTPSHGNQQHLHTRLSHPAPFQTVSFAFSPQLCQTLQFLPRHVNHWLISEALRGGGRAEPAP